MSHRPSRPSSPKRPRHRITVFRFTESCFAIATSDSPAAAARTIRQRKATCCGVPCADVHCSNFCRSTSDSWHDFPVPEHNVEWPLLSSYLLDTNTSISKSYEQLREANHLMIAQIRDEIQALHSEMDNSRRSLLVDRATGAWNRQKIETRMEELLERKEGFVAIVMWVSNIKRLEASCANISITGRIRRWSNGRPLSWVARL